MEAKLFLTKTGEVSGSVVYFDGLTQQEKTITLCSRFNPVEEARRWAEQVYDSERESYIIFGLGLGYHISQLVKLLDRGQQVYIIEANTELHSQIKSAIDQRLFKHTQIHCYITDNVVEIKKVLDELADKHAKLVIHDTLLKILPDQALKQVLENYQFRQNTVISGRHTSLVRENYAYYKEQNYPNMSSWYNTHRGKPLIIVSGGPSLDKNIEELKQVNEEIFIFAVGRVLKLLLAHNIKVDMFCMIDPHHELTAVQIEGVENQGIPMAFLNTASYLTVEKYKGPKYIAYSMDSPKGTEGRIETGGSVATAILDLAIKFGANPIIFVGQDLAYTDNKSHVKESENTYEVQALKNMARVKGWNGEYLLTSKSMLSFKYYIEDKIRQNPDVKFYNCTQGGAYIQGCKHEDLYTVLEKLKLINP